MPIDRVIPIKQETDTVGDSADAVEWFNTPAQRNEDALDVRGVYVQNDSSNDGTVLITRDASNNMTFTDGVVGTTYTLTELAAGGGGGMTESSHKALRDLIHFIDEGPADGFTSGAYRTTTYSGPFITQIRWWTSAAQTASIVRLDITYNANKTIATEVWRMYASDGTTVTLTLTDTYAYSGILETSRTRTWA